MDLFADDAAAQAVAELAPAEDAAQAPPAPPEAAQAPEEASEEIPAFDPRHKEVYTGLLWVGALSRREVLFGHSFDLSTPTTRERLEMGQLLEPFAGTPSAQVAYSTALVAAYLRRVDDLDLPEPIGPKDTGLRGRFEWVQDNLRRPVVEALFDRALVLEGQVDEVLEDMGKASG